MKNNPIKTYLRILAWLFLFLPNHVETIQMPWYHSYFHKLNGVRYAKHCSLIHAAQKIRGGALLTYYRLTHKKINLNKAISLIKNKLTEFETWLLTLEQDTLIAIKEKYHMSDDIWQKCVTDTQNIKNHYKNEMQHKHPNITHDPAVPADIVEMLTMFLQHSNINPHSLHIKMVLDPTMINENPDTMVQVQSFINTTVASEKLVIMPSYVPATIDVFPVLINHSLSEKMSFCAHEIQHLIQQHSLTDLVLREYLEHYYGINSEILEQSEEYHILCQIHEAQAEILSAIKSAQTADCHTMMRKKYLYPDHLYEEHFIHLSTIDMLWKVNAWLEFFQQNGIVKKKNALINSIKKLFTQIKGSSC